jgi:dihydrodipicolinate synthase/N-acetylneuraminate lyase
MAVPAPAAPPLDLLRPRRGVAGTSEVLLPFDASGAVAWEDFSAHVARTAEAGLVPAVNMATGYVGQIDRATREAVLDRTRAVLDGGSFVAGAFVADLPGAAFDLRAYASEAEGIQKRGGVPVILQSYGLTGQAPDAVLRAYREIGKYCPRFLASEVGTVVAPYGSVYDPETFVQLMEVPQCIGARHGSMSRTLEWERIRLRDAHRPEFGLLTGNDLAIDMVMYGSDHLMGLSTFAPDAFARRDALWAAGDPSFYELNDVLQYLGAFAYRDPVPAYRHSAAQFLRLRGWVASDAPHPEGLARPASDLPVLQALLERLEALLAFAPHLELPAGEVAP